MERWEPLFFPNVISLTVHYCIAVCIVLYYCICTTATVTFCFVKNRYIYIYRYQIYNTKMEFKIEYQNIYMMKSTKYYIYIYKLYVVIYPSGLWCFYAWILMTSSMKLSKPCFASIPKESAICLIVLKFWIRAILEEWEGVEDPKHLNFQWT